MMRKDLLFLMSCVGCLATGYLIGHAPILNPTETYIFNSDKLTECHNTTIIKDGVTKTNWFAITSKFYVSNWLDGPQTCEEFKRLFTKDVQ